MTQDGGPAVAEPTAMNLRYSIFPKFLQSLTARELAAAVREAGLDTCNLVIRDGYWVSKKALTAQLPAFLDVMRGEGLEVTFATAGFSVDELQADETPLALLREHGIAEFRMDYFKAPSADVRAALDDARRKMAVLAALCEKHGVRAIYQVHHGTLIPGATGAYHLVNGLDPRHVGVELDPGNQTHEGYEDWARSAHLLGEYLVALGVKDSRQHREPSRGDEPGKGWSRWWCPIDEGVVNWHSVLGALKSVGFSGTLVFMPFYEPHNVFAQLETLKREVTYLRGVEAAVRASG
jgi:sugar phosphate isomerase/epimerase